ncbi:MAG: hypothetical protein IJ373_06050 [Clostridia bacterium]|nr:hypothetical protein [Clostridia bacterium]
MYENKKTENTKKAGVVRANGGRRVLNKRETEVMNVIFSLCHDKGVGLISPAEILDMLPPKRRYTEERVEEILNELALDDYFELLSSERKGEKMYVISLRSNGYAFKRGYVQMRRDALLKIFWAAVSAVIAFTVGLLLKRIF